MHSLKSSVMEYSRLQRAKIHHKKKDLKSIEQIEENLNYFIAENC